MIIMLLITYFTTDRVLLSTFVLSPLTAEVEKNKNNNLISDYFNQACSGIPKKRANTATDKITAEKTKVQGAMYKSARLVKRQDNQLKQKSDGSAPSNFFKTKENIRNYSVGEKNTELETTVSKCTKKICRFGESNGQKRLIQVLCGVVGIT